MKPVKVLVPTLLAIGLIRYNQSLTGADTKSGEAKPIDTKAQDVADLKAVEDRFMTAFRPRTLTRSWSCASRTRVSGHCTERKKSYVKALL